LELYRAAARRFPEVAVMHQGRGCCAGHMGERDPPRGARWNSSPTIRGL
jgi:hypothetical protein